MTREEEEEEEGKRDSTGSPDSLIIFDIYKSNQRNI